jgi:mono/diheme cytochrome c family protein
LIARALALLALAGLIASVALAADRTVWDGVYTTAQAGRGKAIYTAECQSCHGERLGGGFDAAEQVPALKRGDFGLSRRDLNNLYGFVLESMPRNEPGNLSAANAVDVIAYILQQNGFPAGGTDLVPDPSVLETILIVKKP